MGPHRLHLFDFVLPAIAVCSGCNFVMTRLLVALCGLMAGYKPAMAYMPAGAGAGGEVACEHKAFVYSDSTMWSLVHLLSGYHLDTRAAFWKPGKVLKEETRQDPSTGTTQLPTAIASCRPPRCPVGA